MLLGDFVIARKDTPTSYHLSVTVDDHLQGVTVVTRGEDILPSTHVHVPAAAPAGIRDTRLRPSPLCWLGPDGRRLAKRDKSTSIRALRESGMTPEEVLPELIGPRATRPARGIPRRRAGLESRGPED